MAKKPTPVKKITVDDTIRLLRKLDRLNELIRYASRKRNLDVTIEYGTNYRAGVSLVIPASKIRPLLLEERAKCLAAINKAGKELKICTGK